MGSRLPSTSGQQLVNGGVGATRMDGTCPGTLSSTTSRWRSSTPRLGASISTGKTTLIPSITADGSRATAGPFLLTRTSAHAGGAKTKSGPRMANSSSRLPESIETAVRPFTRVKRALR